MEEGGNVLNDGLIQNFPHNPIDLLKEWYKLGKHFKTRNLNEYLTNALRFPYQYDVAMVCKLYGEPNGHKFKITWVPLIHYVTFAGSSFNWEYIISSTVIEAIVVFQHMDLGNFPSFHMSYYILDITCVT
jgi:hypothetical protein